MVFWIPDVDIHRVFVGCSCSKEANIVLSLLKALEYLDERVWGIINGGSLARL
jgi:hypothetical protein